MSSLKPPVDQDDQRQLSGRDLSFAVSGLPPRALGGRGTVPAGFHRLLAGSGKLVFQPVLRATAPVGPMKGEADRDFHARSSAYMGAALDGPAMTVTQPVLVRVRINLTEGGQSGRAAGNRGEPRSAASRSRPEWPVSTPWYPRAVTGRTLGLSTLTLSVEVIARLSSSGPENCRCPSPGQPRCPGRSRVLCADSAEPSGPPPAWGLRHGARCRPARSQALVGQRGGLSSAQKA